MECQIQDIWKVFSVLPNAQKKLPIPRLQPGQYQPPMASLHQITGLVPVTVRPCVETWNKPYRDIKQANRFAFRQPVVLNPISNSGKQFFLTNACGNLPQGSTWVPIQSNAVQIYSKEPVVPVFTKPWHRPSPYTLVSHTKTQDDQGEKTAVSTELTDHPEGVPASQQPSETQNEELTVNTCKGKKGIKNLKPYHPKCNKTTFMKSMNLVSVEAVHKPSVWLNVTLQVDTSSEIKRDQPVAQYRSIISSVLTKLYFPPKLSPPGHLYRDKMAATASYDERGRLTVLEVEFITAGIYKVENISSGLSGQEKSNRKSVTLTRIESLETLSSKSQYLIMGDLCPVPKTLPKCHRNALTLHKKLIEFMYTREFRKHTLPLLAQVGEEDVWTSAIKAPRTRSRASEYDDDQFNKLFVKRKPPSSPNSPNEEEEASQNPKRGRYSGNKSPVKRFSDNNKMEEESTCSVSTPLPRRSRRLRSSPPGHPSSNLQTPVSPTIEEKIGTLLEETSLPVLQQSQHSGLVVPLPTSPDSRLEQRPDSSSSSVELDSICSLNESEQSLTPISEQSLTPISQPNSPFSDVQIGESRMELHVQDEVVTDSGRTSPLTELSEQTTELLSHLMSKVVSSPYSSSATENLLPAPSCDPYPLTSQLQDILSHQNYSPNALDLSNSVTDSIETVLPLEPLDLPELTFWDEFSIPLNLSLPSLSSDLPLDLSCKSKRRF